ncbi:MAG: single-stranded DNA-binding protein, partial [Thermoplasmatales archaeon]|nr:single-stranded DNA-binding protein [Thermoplasmatales archaeon]
MNEKELAPHVEELKKGLEEKATGKELMDELNKYVNDYGVDIDSAKRAIRRKFGGEETGFVTGDTVSKKIGDLTGSETNVDITAKIIYVEKRQIHARGEDKMITSGILG